MRKHNLSDANEAEAKLTFLAMLNRVGAHIAILCCAAVLAACGMGSFSAGSARQANSEALDLQRFLILTRPPVVSAYKTDDVEQAQQRMARMRPADLQWREGSRVEDANSLPWLIGSPIGRKFLATPAPRVLVRGTPSAFCPVAVVESGPLPVPDLAANALRSCLSRSTDNCGCQVVAAGSVLLIKQEETTYATAISARIRAPSLGLDGFLVAEEGRDGEILLRDLGGVIGRIDRDGGDEVVVKLERQSGSFRGRSIKVGFRRGRLAERIYASDGDGNRLSLLIGFDPEELAELAGAWLAWPQG